MGTTDKTKEMSFDNGFIKISRKILDWEWYTDTNTVRVFLHCILKANWKDKRWRGIEIKRGSFITSRAHMAKDLHMSEQEVRTAIEHLELTNEITKYATAKYSVITVVKYNDYQMVNQVNNQQTANKSTKKQPSSNQVATTTEERKEREEGKKIIKPPHRGWEMIIPHNPQSILDHHPADGWVYEVVDGVKWAHKEKQKK